MAKTKEAKAVEEKVEQPIDETADSPMATEEKVTEEDFTPKTIEEGEEESTVADSEDATSEEDTGEESKDDDLDLDKLSLDDFQEKEEKKTGVQKRIDKLVAEKKSLEERLDKVEKRSDSKTPEYSEAQLRQAMAKAMEENDPNLMWEIMDYRVKKEKQSALGEERQRQQEYILKQQKAAQEWHSTVDEYSYLSEDDTPELFKGSHQALNVKDQNSLLLQLATKLYRDPQYTERYQKDGGQRLAVSDAIKIILKKKNAKVTSKKTEQLERKLAKEKRKSSVSSGSAEKKEKSKPKSSGNKLEDYLNERKSDLMKARGGL